ncbi:serine protease [Kitasatospora sp. NPDC056138]|uniref:serine protease n=1 Tax=Kitasatospora sp. NPDC056138 TaxID=3345724 RepID=UPI0035D7F1FF
MAAGRWSDSADGRLRTAADPGQALLRICGPDGRTRGLGFVVDLHGTVVTAHETVAGLDRLVLHTEGGQTRVLGADCIEGLAPYGLALVRTEAVGGLPVPPLPIGGPARGGEPVAVPYLRDDGAVGTGQGGVLGAATAMYPWRDEFHLIAGALWLDLSAAGAVFPAGAPVVDAGTGAVLGVVAPSLPAGHGGGAVAVPLVLPRTGTGPGNGAAGAAEALAGAVARNAATVPAYGRALNLAGVLQLASVQLGSAVAGPGRIADLAADRVDRPDGLTGEEPQEPLTVLVGAPGSGRTTELAALTVRRAGGPHPLPTLWLRGADLGPADASLVDAVGRVLARAAGLLAVDPPEPGRAARLCAEAGRPLLVVLDAPEEAPAAAGAPWLRATSEWLRTAAAGLLVACGPECWSEWERADGSGTAGARVHGLGPLPEEAAERATRRYGLAGRPPSAPDAQGGTGPAASALPLERAEAAHPVALRIAGELQAAGVRWQGTAPRRGELFEGFLDLSCLRIAQRLADGGTARRPGAHRRGGPRQGAAEPGRVRRLAVVVAGRVHEAARQMLGSGHGGLSADAFELLFPAAGGWASAVLGERLFVAVGDGYRLAHEELGAWLQGRHLDLDGALRLLLEEDGPDGADAVGPPVESVMDPAGGEGSAEPGDRVAGAAAPGCGRRVPRHRAGPVVVALTRIGETWGAEALDGWLHRLWRALEIAPADSEPAWWAGHLLTAVLRSGTDLSAHRPLLAQLAERGERTGAFGPGFWAALPLAPAARLDLLRCLVRADGPAQSFRAATAEALAADPHTVIPLLCHWFEDSRRLPARPDCTVADLAHDLLYAHRRLALDDLTECLVETGHPRADALLSLLAADEPSALCRAVDRWSHDPRPERHVAAAVHALRTAPYATGPGPELLRFTATALLAREDEPSLHGAALALLVRDGRSRGRYLAAAIARYLADDPFVTAEVLAPALAEDPEPVLAAFRQRLAAPDAALAEGLRVLAEVADPAVARRGLDLAAELLHGHPERGGRIADYLDRLFAGATEPQAGAGPQPAGAEAGEHDGAQRAERAGDRAVRSGAARRLCAEPREVWRVLALGAQPAQVRRVFAVRLATPGPPSRGPLLDALLTGERDEDVLAAVLECLAERCAEHDPSRARELVRRIALRTAEADTVLVRCAGRSAEFARLLAEWPAAENPLVSGPLLTRMRALVAAGRDPQYAAAEAERGALRPQPREVGLPVPKQTRAHGTL